MDGVARGGEEKGASGGNGRHVVFVHLLEVDFMRAALALDVACPPIPPLVCQVAAVDANLPPVLSLDTFPAQSDGDDLVAETDADEFEVLVCGRGGEGADELDKRGDKGVGGIVRGVFGPGEHDTVVCVGSTVLESLKRWVLFLVDDVVGVDDEVGVLGDGGVGVCGERVCEPFGVYGVVCGCRSCGLSVGGDKRGETYSCQTL